MGKSLLPPGGGDHIQAVDLKKALEERYLAYALSTIMHRALPDVRDGMKPVHRRIVYAMSEMGLKSAGSFKKCAKIVGEVMGNFHPHGDQSIYDALVRLAQDFSVRYPLANGQGNFGNIDGDSAAAMRYTESKMTAVAELLIEGIGEDAVDFRTTYDEENSEPVVLPGAFPNLLANGATGIAVGMATSIPPHNAAELCDAALALIRKPEATVEDLLQYVEGPDFPTGGIVIDSRESILEDVRDESAEDVRLVLIPKSRAVDPTLLMESLFRLSDLENRIPLNLNVLSMGKVPKVMNLVEVLTEWLAHRREVLQRRSRHRLAAIERRLELLAGYLIAYLNLDEVIRIIREEDEPKLELMKTFELNEIQAEAILNMRLRSLRKLEEMEIRKEFDGLTGEKAEIEELLGSDAKQWQTVAWEVGKVRKTFSKETELGARRTKFAEAPVADLAAIEQAMIEKEPITVVISEKGWIRGMKGHMADYAGLQFKDGDSLKLAFHANTTDKLVIVTTGGKAYTLPGGRGHGEPLRIIVDMDNDQAVLTAFVHDPARKLLVASTAGNGFIVAESDMVANTRKGKQIMNVSLPVEMRLCVPISGDHVAIIGENRKMLIFPLEQLPAMSRGKGVRLQRYKDGGVADIRCFAMEDGLTWEDSAGRMHNRKKEELVEWIADRAQAGRLVPKGFPRSGKFS